MNQSQNKNAQSTSLTRIARCTQKNCGCLKNSFVWISHERKIIWFEVPKVASRSMKSAWGILGPGREKNSGFVNLHKMPLEVASEYSNYFKFALIRNPWDKMVSNWFMFCKSNIPRRMQQIEDLFGMPPGNIDFPTFLQHAIVHRNHHWEQCVNFLPIDNQNKLLLDLIGQLDDIETCISTMKHKFGIELQLPRENTTNHSHYSNYYDTESIDIVRTMFPRDIAVFNFTFQFHR
ncbi:sulfotransferase family 2 domain-containing protein [Candidatus Uabimicrobium amorphum]|uniref:Sulfotransferase family protein n=1 Tax=Uabimicrobium amorphum TaxID=2596890 RepID=A0A5S9F7A1_UABAM|nr:sulfotransferase family 2 domain-containing protein [Candidatus Uabimicrobium amorphum]BBM87489.1 hypothetical protein UABAM_05901 [Candidatus Uabimicrobium amorphum]